MEHGTLSIEQLRNDVPHDLDRMEIFELLFVESASFLDKRGAYGNDPLPFSRAECAGSMTVKLLFEPGGDWHDCCSDAFVS